MTNTTPEFSAEDFKAGAIAALVPAAVYIRDAMRGKVDLSEYLVKPDKSAVSVVDNKSREISRPIILERFPGRRLNQEDAQGESGAGSRVMYHDPLDGTVGFLMGEITATNILGEYDPVQKKVLGVATMEPRSGRFWFSAEGEGTRLNEFDYSTEKWEEEEWIPVHVNNHSLDGGQVSVDVTHPFSRLNGTKQILYQGGRRALANEIENLGAKEGCFHTNGGGYALLATGRPTLVGHISTAIGGSFDVLGLRHVIESGGVAQCYGIKEEGERVLQVLEHPQDIENADIVIAANMPDTLRKLEDVVGNAVSYRA